MLKAISRRNVLQLAGAGAWLGSRMATAQRARPSMALRQHVDPEWFYKALADETERWLKAAEMPSGFVHERLDRKWVPLPQPTATLTSQSRQIFMRARGYDLTHKPVYLESLKKVADFLLANFRDSRYGGLVFSVNLDGKVMDDQKDSYGTAFVIFGLSHATRVTKNDRYRQAALETWAEMKKRFRDKAGFYRLSMSRDYSQARGTLSQNPMMHLFEALLALYDATGCKEILSEAEAHGTAMFTKLFQDKGGYLPEFYDGDWKPLPASRQGHPDLGHQFEWAFLWSHAVDHGFPRRYLQQFGERELNYGMKVAYDTEIGGIFSNGDYDGRPVKASKGLWQQCEFLRALMNYAVVHNHSELWAAFDKSLAMFKQHFVDADYGGHFSSYYDPNSPGDASRLAKSGTDCYHVVGMFTEALRLCGVMG